MNWNSKSVSEVSKEKIWKEHVINEAHNRHIFDTFRVNPHRLRHNKPISQPLNLRPRRFLDRERAFLDMLETKSARGTHNDDGDADTSFSTYSPEGTGNGTTASGYTDAAPPAAVTLPAIRPPHTPSRGATGATTTATDATQGRTSDDAVVQNLLLQMQKLPAEKYEYPMVESHEIGWTSPRRQPHDPRFRFGLKSCDITRFAGALQASKQLANSNKGK